jgi:hypothetical protein
MACREERLAIFASLLLATILESLTPCLVPLRPNSKVLVTDFLCFPDHGSTPPPLLTSTLVDLRISTQRTRSKGHRPSDANLSLSHPDIKKNKCKIHPPFLFFKASVKNPENEDAPLSLFGCNGRS